MEATNVVPRRMLYISWTAKKSNILKEADTRSLINRLHKRQATFFDHRMRREKQEHLVTTGMIEGKTNVKRCWMDLESG